MPTPEWNVENSWEHRLSLLAAQAYSGANKGIDKLDLLSTSTTPTTPPTPTQNRRVWGKIHHSFLPQKVIKKNLSVNGWAKQSRYFDSLKKKYTLANLFQ